MFTDESNCDVTATIIAMANSLNRIVLAAGAEDRGQLDFLKDREGSIYQRYCFSKPLPKPDICAALQSRQKLPVN